MTAFNVTGRVCPDYYEVTVSKRERLLSDRALLAGPTAPPEKTAPAEEKPPKARRFLSLFRKAGNRSGEASGDRS